LRKFKKFQDPFSRHTAVNQRRFLLCTPKEILHYHTEYGEIIITNAIHPSFYWSNMSIRNLSTPKQLVKLNKKIFKNDL